MNLDGLIYDFRLGYVRAGTTGGFDIFGEDDAEYGRIVTLGSRSGKNSQKSWGQGLFEALDSKVQVYDGCTDGYGAAQELLMLIRDGVLLAPKLVICLSGFNDFAYKFGFVQEKRYADILKTHPFATPAQIAFYEKITTRFGLGNDKVFYGEANNSSCWEYWLKQTESIHLICEEFGIEHLTFLQPCVFSGRYVISEDEKNLICSGYNFTSEEFESFGFQFKESYSQVVARLPKYVVDMSSVFYNDSNAYQGVYELNVKYTDKMVALMSQRIKEMLG